MFRRVLWFVGYVAVGLSAQEYQSNAPFSGVAGAEARAAQLDVGRVELVGPSEVVVGTYEELRLRLTIGTAGLATGGAVHVLSQHGFTWDMWGGVRLQEQNPAWQNYLTYRTSTGSRLRWR